MTRRSWVVLSLATLLVAGCSAGPGPTKSTTPSTAATAPTSPRFGHEHSVFRMFNEQGEVNFTNLYFDYSRTHYARAHLHLAGPESSGAQYVIHAEGELGFNLTEFFTTEDVHLGPDRITLDEHVHAGRVTVNDASRSWQLWVDPCRTGDDHWHKQASISAYQPSAFDRMLITFASGNATASTLGSETAQVPSHQTLEAQLRGTCAGPT